MGTPILAVDTDLAVWTREREVWRRHGIDVQRVDSMRDAIEKLCRGVFLFTSINADCILYLPLLPAMRELTETPICVITSHFTIPEQVQALENGADAYAPFRTPSEHNVLSALALLQSYSRRRSHAAKPIVYRGLIVEPALHTARLHERKLKLTPREFDILALLARNAGRPMSKEHIYARVWKEDNCHDINHLVANHVQNLKRKIGVLTGKEIIHTEWGIGYKLE